MKKNPIYEGDWVLICETGEKGIVVKVYDEGERFLIDLPICDERPFHRTAHVMVEKIRKIRPIKPKNKWKQENLF